MPKHLSGQIRFSVESLLYYAPKITQTGDALWRAVDTTQRDILGLGPFWGDNHPDQKFKNSYPRAQYAMLIIARQLADEIIGIGAGVEDMARTYGITENQNIADVQKIQASQRQVNANAYHSGGWENPPPIPEDIKHQQPVHPPPPKRIPHPQPTPVPPKPRPGWQQKHFDKSTDIRSLIGPWPAGDPTKMDEAARAWNRLTEALDTAWSDLQRYRSYIVADAEGPAADAFDDYVDGFIARSHGSLTHSIQFCQDLRDVCNSQAQLIRNLKTQIEIDLASLVATLVIGTLFATVTFGSAEVIAAGASSEIAVTLTATVEAFGTASGIASETIGTISASLANVLVAGISGGAGAVLDVGVKDVINLAFGKDPIDGADAEKQVLDGAKSGLIGGIFTEDADAAAPKLAHWANQLEKEDPDTAAALKNISEVLAEKHTWAKGIKDNLQQLITSGKITPADLIKAQVSSRFSKEIDKHLDS